MKGLPEVLACQDSDGGRELRLRVPDDCPWFRGHFPGHPILPGVVQIGWAVWFAARWTGRERPPTGLSRIKFHRPIGPGARLSLHLARRGGKLEYVYRLLRADGPVAASSGRFDEAGST